MHRLTRRRVLAGAGTMTAGALLAACGADAGPEDVPTTAEVPTTTGTTATVQARTATRDGLAARFDDAPACARTAELTEGPYYLDVDKVRTDIREGRPGARLRVGVRVRDGDADCAPLRNAVVEIWQCDAGGAYSGVQGQGGTFLRGAQVTNTDGIAELLTIYPGAYPGRCPHIHAKVLLDSRTALTTQVFFADDVSERVYARAPYPGGAWQRNADDGIYVAELELTLIEEDGGWLGLVTFDVTRPA